MSRVLPLLILTIAGSLVPPASLAGAQAAPPLAANPKAEKAEKPARISLAEAERRVRAKILSEKPKMAPDDQFPLKELTTDAIWKQLGVQVFQVTGGAQHCETFVIKKGDVTRFGRGIGGDGVQSMCVADLGKDGKSELVYSFSWGSGIHRAEVGVLTFDNSGAKEHIAPFAYRYPGGSGNLSLKCVDKQVAVFDGRQRLGEVVLAKKGKSWAAAVRLDGDLPAEFRECALRFQKQRVW